MNNEIRKVNIRKIVKRKKSKVPKILLISGMSMIILVAGGKFFNYAINDLAERLPDIKPYGYHEKTERELIFEQYYEMSSDENLSEIRDEIVSNNEVESEFFEKEFDQRIDMTLYLYKTLESKLEKDSSRYEEINNDVQFLEHMKNGIMMNVSMKEIENESINKTVNDLESLKKGGK